MMSVDREAELSNAKYAAWRAFHESLAAEASPEVVLARRMELEDSIGREAIEHWSARGGNTG